MRPIPTKLREEMSNDPFYMKCCLAHLGGCQGRIEWHHSIIYAGRQLNEKWAILPACQYHHRSVAHFNFKFIQIALNRATDEELLSISKAENYIDLRKRLNENNGKRN